MDGFSNAARTSVVKFRANQSDATDRLIVVFFCFHIIKNFDTITLVECIRKWPF